MTESRIVHYEDFGAVGDGVTDDLPAICAAHAHANRQGLPVASTPGVTYHLGGRALTATIATDTDWSTSRFTIDDTDVEDYTKPLFKVCSLLEPEELHIHALSRDQQQSDLRPAHDCFVRVTNERHRKYIRRGLNQTDGVPQQDAFVLRQDGTISSPIDWEYEQITSVEAYPIDRDTLTISGGIFTTLANRVRQGKGYNYWARNIVITRSNTEVEGVTHYVVGETDVGQPYRGFLCVNSCAGVTLRNCFVAGHRTYTTIGTAGEPTGMGSYDLHASRAVNLRLIECRMHHILDQSRWGVIATDFCKNISLEDCVLSRMDSHMGVSGSYTIRGCRLGHAGLNAVGRGKLLIEDSTLHGSTLVNLRADYGSSWEGECEIRNCRWIPACGDPCGPVLCHQFNDGTHDFGYRCSMPWRVTVDGLTVDDRQHPDDYEGLFYFSDPDGPQPAELPDERPFPYQKCRDLRVRGLVALSGKKPRISPNREWAQSIGMVEEF